MLYVHNIQEQKNQKMFTIQYYLIEVY